MDVCGHRIIDLLSVASGAAVAERTENAQNYEEK
jgi:hypothetical protein